MQEVVRAVAFVLLIYIVIDDRLAGVTGGGGRSSAEVIFTFVWFLVLPQFM